MNDNYKQLMLISSKLLKQNNKKFYQVQKEGLLFLRKFQGKKFKIILNVISIQSNYQVHHQLNRLLIQESNNNKAKSQIENHKQNIEQRLTISSNFKQISQNKIIIIFNLYTQFDNPDLFYMCYLTSSLMIVYDFKNEISKQKKLFSSLQQNLQIVTQKLSQKPQIILLRSQYHNKQNQQINLDSLFSEQTTLILNENLKEIAIEITNKLSDKMTGRKIMEYSLSCKSIQSLLFQICQHINNNKLIQLKEIYNKIIQNIKTRFLNECFKYYLYQVSQKFNIDLQKNNNQLLNTNCNLLISRREIMTILQKIKQKTNEFSFTEAITCMSLEQFYQKTGQLNKKISQVQQKLLKINQQKCNEIVFQSYKALKNELDQQNCNTSKCIKDIFDLMINKIQCFNNQCIIKLTEPDQNSKIFNESLLQLIKDYNNRISELIFRSMKKKEENLLVKEEEINQLKYEIKKITLQKKKIQDQYQIQVSISESYKEKVKQMISNSNQSQKFHSNRKNQSYYKDLKRMRKKIQQLQQQIQDKDNHIEQLMNILDKFQVSKTISCKYDKRVESFNLDLQKLINQSNTKINHFYQLFQEIRKIQKHYENTKKLLIKQQEKIASQKKQYLKLNSQLKNKFEKHKNQNQKLFEIIHQQKKTLDKQKQLYIQLKSTIDRLENQNAQLKCTLAQTQSELETYERTARLVIEHYVKGKSDNLMKFYKFLENQQIKELLKPIINKK